MSESTSLLVEVSQGSQPMMVPPDLTFLVPRGQAQNSWFDMLPLMEKNTWPKMLHVPDGRHVTSSFFWVDFVTSCLSAGHGHVGHRVPEVGQED